jgi:hypothetical protein
MEPPFSKRRTRWKIGRATHKGYEGIPSRNTSRLASIVWGQADHRYRLKYVPAPPTHVILHLGLQLYIIRGGGIRNVTVPITLCNSGQKQDGVEQRCAWRSGDSDRGGQSSQPPRGKLAIPSCGSQNLTLAGVR